MEKYFAAFIMTYQRSAILESTIVQICKQTFPPEKILIVDNSQDFETEELIRRLENTRLEYHRVGYNAGPAGVARIGLKQLAEEGFQWIFWGDDDLPKTLDCFEKLLSNVNVLEKPGIVGAVGHRVNTNSMSIQRTCDDLIRTRKWIEVDVIAGGMCMGVNADVIKGKPLPDERIFDDFSQGHSFYIQNWSAI